MKGGFSNVLVANISIPKSRFKSSKDCISCPKTQNYSLVGTAFDYLLRSELKRLHPNAKEGEFIAELSIILISEAVYSTGYFQAKNAEIGSKELNLMRNIADNFKEKRATFLKSGILADDFIETTIKYAKLDVIFRAGIYDDIEKDVDQLDIEDLKSLYKLIPEEFKMPSEAILLDPTFGEASRKVEGADVDLIIGHAMIDIKTTKEMKLDRYIWSQIVGYLMLSDHAYEKEGLIPKIEEIGLYFSRYGYLWKIEASYVRENPNYEDLKNKLLKNS
jgi:hypothetical protein